MCVCVCYGTGVRVGGWVCLIVTDLNQSFMVGVAVGINTLVYCVISHNSFHQV